MKNRIFLVSCLILIFISIASVSASENINQTLDITDNGNSDIIGIPASNIDANDTVSLVYDENNIGISNEETAGNVLYVNGIQTGGNDILNSNYIIDSVSESLKNNEIYIAVLKYAAKQDLNVSIVADPITIGQDAIVVISGLADATGNITLTVYGMDYQFPITDSEMGLGIPGLFENTTVVFTYPGDENYNNFTKSVDIIVNRVESNISIIVSDGYEGNQYNVNVKLPGGASGNVTIILNGKEQTIDIADAQIFPIIGALIMRVPYDNLTVGNYNVTAIYYGDYYYGPSNASAQFIISPKENVTMNISASSVFEGENVTIDIEFPLDASGTDVTAVVDGENFTAYVYDSDVKIILPALPAGNYTIPIIYDGNYKYCPLTREVNVSVKSKSDIINAPDVTKYFSGSERFVVTVTDFEGNLLANKTVIIDINGVSYTRTTDVNGSASIALGLNSGVYDVNVTVDNQTVNAVVTILTTVNGTDITKVFRNDTQYFATFRDSEGNYLKEGSDVRFNINGVMYDRKVSGDKGLVKLNINLKQGKYIITAINLVTGEFTANNITVIPKIIENYDITKYYRNGTQYTVKIIGDDGNPVGAGETVNFNINGVFYQRQTDANGTVKLNINLNPGDYIVTAEYKGSMVANNIKVLPVLSAEDLTKMYGTQDPFVATLVDGQGNPCAYQKIEFNINGVLYYRTTDNSGQAKLNIYLMPGEYIITSSYNGSSIANTIKIYA